MLLSRCVVGLPLETIGVNAPIFAVRFLTSLPIDFYALVNNGENNHKGFFFFVFFCTNSCVCGFLIILLYLQL